MTTPTAQRLLTFPSAVQAQANRTPEAPAIVCAGETITFRALSAQMNRVANFLLQRGVSRTHRVGLFMRRGEAVGESISLLLGILQVAAYVPLDADPGFPTGRLATMLEDAGIELVLTHRRFASALQRACARIRGSVTILCIDELYEELAGASQESPPDDQRTGMDDLAYILYTSGTSTGKPKGVLVGHASLTYFGATQNALVGIRPGDRATQFFSLSFDASLSDLSMLAAGATLYALPPNALLGGQALLDFLRDQQITVATFIPTVWLTLPVPFALPALRILLLGGEMCPASLVQLSSRPGLRIYNVCGLTETTVAYALGECQNDGLPPPIGKAFPGVEVSIRNERLERVPSGDEGHICISGPCLALGYTDPRLTASRFVPDPEAGNRTLFLTFDSGVMDEDGTIWLKDRIDKARRLKVSGKLVSLDEVEEHLLQMPEVSEAAVVHFEGRIVAYVSLRPGASWSFPLEEPGQEWEIRRSLDLRLREILPAYMLPCGYAVLPHLPRTPSSDKLDRDYLRDEVTVTWVSQDDPSTFVRASTRVEQLLAQIVAEYLTENMQQIDQARRALSPGEDWAEDGQEDPPQVGWQEINIAGIPSEMGIDSVFAPRYTLDVAERLGVEIENRELFCPVGDTARAIEFLLAQMAETAGHFALERG